MLKIDVPESLDHKPVLLQSFLDAVAPVHGAWLDCTFGAGGYSLALCAAGATKVFGIDCDPEAYRRGHVAEKTFSNIFHFIHGRFGQCDEIPEIGQIAPLQGVVFDLGVSSMQFDTAERGFSLRRDGPLDMRMCRTGWSAADLINDASESLLSEIFSKLGEEHAARRIARRIVQHRSAGRIESTFELAAIVAKAVTHNRSRRFHPATRVFQSLRMAVNDELMQLAQGLSAAERILCKGGFLAVISFHSLEDRIVKRFMRGDGRDDSTRQNVPTFEQVNRRPVGPSREEISSNPRSRSARLRVAVRSPIETRSVDYEQLGVPRIMGMESWQCG